MIIYARAHASCKKYSLLGNNVEDTYANVKYQNKREAVENLQFLFFVSHRILLKITDHFVKCARKQQVHRKFFYVAVFSLTYSAK